MLHNGTDDKFTVEDLWRIFDHLIGGRPVTYYTCPVSSGTRFIEWWTKSGRALKNKPTIYHTSLVEHVIQPNLADAKRLFRETMCYHPEVSHICPAEVNFRAWSHANWMRFWLRFIEQEIISEIICLPGWMASTGCVMEYRLAVSRNLPVREIDSGIKLVNVLASMENYLTTMRSVGLDSVQYEKEYNELRKLRTLVK